MIENSEFLLPLELLFRDVKREDLCNKNIILIKVRLLDMTPNSYQNLSDDRNPTENLTAPKFITLKHLAKKQKLCHSESR